MYQLRRPRDKLVSVAVACGAVAIIGAGFVANQAAAGGSRHAHRTAAVAKLHYGKYLLVSQTPQSEAPNAAASEPTISQDKRTAVAIAYVSSATDITSSPTGGFSNVFLVSRKRPWDQNANTPWRIATTVQASRGKSAPNGDSWGPSLSGGDMYNARCLAFISNASNLVSADRNRRADIFVRPLSANRLTRIETNGSPTSISVDGQCKKIAYTSVQGAFIQTLGGGTQKISGGKATNITINSWDSDVSFQRGDSIFLWNRVSGERKIAAGTNPKLSLNAKVVTYQHAGSVRAFNLITHRTQTIGRGSQAAPTVSGMFIFWVEGNQVRSTSSGTSTCDGGPQSPETSAHGNYLIFLCPPAPAEAPQVYLNYVGGK
jgi:hypothetical protein